MHNRMLGRSFSQRCYIGVLAGHVDNLLVISCLLNVVHVMPNIQQAHLTDINNSALVLIRMLDEISQSRCDFEMTKKPDGRNHPAHCL